MLKDFFNKFFFNIRKETQKKAPYVISFFQQLFKYVKLTFEHCKKLLDTFNEVFPRTSQNIQLTFIFFFALIDLLYSVLLNVFNFGYTPEILMPVYPFIEWVFLSPYFTMWASPEKVFLMSFVVLELMIIRSVFRLSKLVKYYILLIFALLMIQGLSVSYWDVLFNREITHNMSKWALDKSIVIYTDKPLAIFFFFNTFIIFILLYSYLYFQAIQGKFALIPYTEWLTDSIAFWLRIKTPTMRFGKRKGSSSKKKEEKLIEEEIEEIPYEGEWVALNIKPQDPEDNDPEDNDIEDNDIEKDK